MKERNASHKIKDVHDSVHDVLQELENDNNLWLNCCRHVIDLENMIREREHIADNFIDEELTPFIIPIGKHLF